MLVLHDPDTLLHETVELLGAKTIPALESPARINMIVSALSHSKHTVEHIKSPLNDAAELNALLRLIQKTHGHDYLDHLKNAFQQWRDANLIEEDESILPECFAFASKAQPSQKALQPPKDIYARPGFFAFDMSSGVMKETYISTIASANLAVQGVEKLRDDAVRDVLALCRPPGHHCDGRRAGGYCYLNNCAIAVSTWRKYSNEARIGILDIDFHHGNGTQDIFYADPQVFYTSIHGEDEFPYYTGSTDEKGTGDAIGSNLNLPLPKNSSFEHYFEKLDEALSAISSFSPDFMVVSLGFDTFRLDPLGSFDIDTEDYETMARTIRHRLSDVPALILLEGGYSLEHLGANLLSFLAGWEAAIAR